MGRYLQEIQPDIATHFYAVRNAKAINAFGWLAEKMQNDENDLRSWKARFVVVTDAEICFFHSTPISKQICREPDLIYPILTTR